MAYFYPPAPSFPLQHAHAYAAYPNDEHAWAPELTFVDNVNCVFEPRPTHAPVDVYNGVAFVPPIYNVSYSLAGAMTPIVEPRQPAPQMPTQSQRLPSSPQRILYADSELSSLSPHSVRYSPDVASSDEFVYEPDIDRSSLSSLSPSPPPAMPVKHEELPPSLASTSLLQGGSSRRVAGRARRTKARDDRSDVFPAPTGEQPYLCDVCGATFVRKHDGERHRRSHTGERPFPCHGGCGKAFRRADARSRHWSVYRDCEWRHTLFLEGTPEGMRRERRILKRAKRAELVAQGVPPQVIERTLKKM